jgi:hypothetical protein
MYISKGGLFPPYPIFGLLLAIASNTYSLVDMKSRGISVGMSLVTCWTAKVRFLGGASDISLLHRVQAGFGVRPAPVGTGDSFPGG